MPGQGKYTTYVPKEKKALLEKMFKGSPYTGLDQDAARKLANEKGDNILRGRSFKGEDGLNSSRGVVDTGTYGVFNGKVDLTYQYRADVSASPEVPNLANVTWDSAKDKNGNASGGPANAYVPDITSPGPGKTDGVDKETNPGITAKDIKPNFVVSDNTRSPSETSAAVRQRTSLSGDNE